MNQIKYVRKFLTVEVEAAPVDPCRALLASCGLSTEADLFTGRLLWRAWARASDPWMGDCMVCVGVTWPDEV